jgi:hypothetical protein
MNERELGGNMEADRGAEFKFWAESAFIRAEETIKKLNPKMGVRLVKGLSEAETVTPEENWVLVFNHPEKPSLGWKWEIMAGEEYLEGLRQDIEETYEKRIERMENKRPQAQA